MVHKNDSLFHEGVQVKRTIVAGLAAALLLAGLAEAKVYKWVDESGKVVFSQTPPPENVPAEEVQVNAPPPATAPKEAEKETVDEKVKGNPALDPELRREYCEKGRKNLEILESAKPGAGFFTEDKKLVKFTPEEKALRMKEAEAAIKAYCD
ncbi:MAG TPA: DUF4124 domain-containing protein [Thiolapillus brandeum]|uniref:DUF4124 domain-containing protein n=1 Tax=Thiolapillus brandeum TaxID=1076588 RepID=A0A831RR27_9GAMM|nr:DUF4124 domain-containing protein [Thiolapillus brandeum]